MPLSNSNYLEVQLDRELIRRGSDAPIASFFLSLLFFAFNPGHLGLLGGKLFAAITMLTAIFRWRMIRTAQRQAEFPLSTLWKTTYAIFIMVQGFAWGALAVWNVRTFGQGHFSTSLILLIAGGFASGALNSLGASPSIFKGMLIGLLVYPGIATFMRGFEGEWRIFCAVFIIYFIFLWRQVDARFRVLVETFRSTSNAREEQFKIQMVMDAIPGLVSYFDAELNYVLVNYRVEEAFGLDRKDILGRRCGFLNRDSNFVNSVQAFVASPKMQEVTELLLDTKDGSRWHLIFLTRVGLNHLICVSLDIHDKKILELENLEQRARIESGAKLASIGEMAGGIAHEINNPLAVILGVVEQLKTSISRGEFNPETAKQRLTKIDQYVQRIARIINGLRKFSRNSVHSDLGDHEFKKILEDTLDLCYERFRNAQVDLVVEITNDRLALFCNETEISQVLLNLLNNAFDAVQSLDARWVKVQAQQVDHFVEISVTDSGLGIPPAVMDKIMQPFFTTKEIGKGTGLGLSISKGIVQSHKGELFLDRGHPHTRFMVRLPIKSDINAAS